MIKVNATQDTREAATLGIHLNSPMSGFLGLFDYFWSEQNNFLILLWK